MASLYVGTQHILLPDRSSLKKLFICRQHIISSQLVTTGPKIGLISNLFKINKETTFTPVRNQLQDSVGTVQTASEEVHLFTHDREKIINASPGKHRRHAAEARHLRQSPKDVILSNAQSTVDTPVIRNPQTDCVKRPKICLEKKNIHVSYTACKHAIQLITPYRQHSTLSFDITTYLLLLSVPL